MFQSFDATTRPGDGPPRLAALRAELSRRRLAGFIVPRADAEAIAAKAEARVANEDSKRRRLAAGELGLDIYDMRARLADKGLKYV